MYNYLGVRFDDVHLNLFQLVRQTDSHLSAFHWDEARQGEFIESLYMRVPCSGFYVHLRCADSPWEVIDGVQRIETLRRFFNGELVLSNLSLRFLKEISLGRIMRRVSEIGTIVHIIREAPADVIEEFARRINPRRAYAPRSISVPTPSLLRLQGYPDLRIESFRNLEF